MSTYHGLACIGEERVPHPQPLPDFPVIHLEFDSSVVINEIDLQIFFRITGDAVLENMRILGKIHLTAIGFKSHQGKFRNYIGAITDTQLVSFILPDFKAVSGLDLQEYQVHLKYFLIDSDSGHRSKEKLLTVGISI